MEADGAVDAQNAPTVPWKTLCVFHDLPQGLSNQITHEKPRKAPKWRWETRIDPILAGERNLVGRCDIAIEPFHELGVRRESRSADRGQIPVYGQRMDSIRDTNRH